MLVMTFLTLIFFLSPSSSHAEELFFAKSMREVTINSSFSGDSITLFGVIIRDSSTVPRKGEYDVIITIASPLETILIRKKESFGPLWINKSKNRFTIPGFYAIFTNRDLNDVMKRDLQERYRLSLSHFMPFRRDAIPERSEIIRSREAIIRQQQKKKKFIENFNGVAMPRKNVFLATISLPGETPIGRYLVTAYLFSDGVKLASASTSFIVRQTGFEAYTTYLARRHATLYGIIAVLLAALSGVFANVVFRRD